MTGKSGKNAGKNSSGLEGINVIRRRLADGSIKEYAYKRLARRPRAPRIAGGIRELAALYVQSPEFSHLSQTWQAAKRYYLGLLEDGLGWMRLEDLERREARAEFYALRDRYAATPAKADKLVDALRGLLAWAHERGRLEYNQALGVRHLTAGRGRADIVWTEEHEALVMASFPASLRLAWRMALYTAARQSDLCGLRWDQVRDGWLSFQPHKTLISTGVWVHLPIAGLPPFAELMGELGRGTEFLLTSENGQPWTTVNLIARWRAAKARSELAGANLRWHDIRGTTVSRLLEAGCSDAEVASVTGHALGSGSSLGDYAARSRRLASNAYAKWAAELARRPQVVALQNAVQNATKGG